MSRRTLPDELHPLILKNLPPLPQVLVRASAVCREWRRIVDDPDFLHQYRARHGAPLTIGFFHNSLGLPRRFEHTGDPASFPFQPPDDHRTWMFVDCRHGRVLLRDSSWTRFLVWHPMTGDRHFLKADTHRFCLHGGCNAALLCAAGDDGEGRHVDCHASPFRVAVVFSQHGRLLAAVFSSLTGHWSPLTYANMPPASDIRREPCAVVGNTLYQLLFDYLVLTFDMDQGSLAMFKRPRGGNVRLMKTDGGVLGLAGVLGSTLRLWARDADAWVLRNTVDLSRILPALPMEISYPVVPREGSRFAWMPPVKIIGVAEDGDVLFLWTMVGIFELCGKSMELKKVRETADNMHNRKAVICRVSGVLPSAIYRALGKQPLYRVPPWSHSAKIKHSAKNRFAEC